QTPGPRVGNGRACALLFAREGARVLSVDRDLDAAEETVALIREEGGTAAACRADVVEEADLEAAVRVCVDRWGRV
ncbi:MAG: SDR family oxidoreductase, partial [Gammaproteobacteria bacterium]|nr:SDR family oxidoreductase [Gammaproteobacteria bacterium]